ncbi:hypothetical protein BV898_07130 [Hypsibius exemplaris]|uniref:Uncharacterized protein n=1 Tax=Hypsibius exemplaris TaxID=2072580 RepID=A0A1W0WUP5_HYPEX|nr:hypothetical protein BV898_07130 [Hypsibius exemplaris]
MEFAASIFVLCFGLSAVTAAGLPFVGHYVSTGQRFNTAAFAAATGFDDPPVENRLHNEFLDQGNGEYLYKFRVENAAYKQELPFKLGETRKSTYNGTEFSYKFTVDGELLKFESKILPDGREVTHTYYPNADGFVKQFQLKDVIAKVWFKKDSA